MPSSSLRAELLHGRLPAGSRDARTVQVARPSRLIAFAFVLTIVRWRGMFIMVALPGVRWLPRMCRLRELNPSGRGCLPQ